MPVKTNEYGGAAEVLLLKGRVHCAINIREVGEEAKRVVVSALAS